MKILRRLLAALGFVGLAALVLGLRGRGGRPPTGDGWRELEIIEHDGGNGSRPGSTENSPAGETS